MSPISRRTLVLGGLAAAGASAFPVRSAVIAATAAVPYPFQLGVASGEPDASSVVLWTRLAPAPTNADGQGGMANTDVTVDWQVSTTDTFSTLVASGSVTAMYGAAHSVHVVATGLNPDYYYRFRAQGHLSPVGRTRTTPAVGTRPRLHLGNEVVALADYRRRYAQYKTDPDLQAAHAAAPWIVVPDDHEVENNYAGTIRENNTPDDHDGNTDDQVILGTGISNNSW